MLIFSVKKEKFLPMFIEKKTFTSTYTNFSSFITESYDTNIIKSLLLRCLQIDPIVAL